MFADYNFNTIILVGINLIVLTKKTCVMFVKLFEEKRLECVFFVYE